MADTRRGVQHVVHPVTPGATHVVVCACGFKTDIKAESLAHAHQVFGQIHRCDLMQAEFKTIQT